MPDEGAVHQDPDFSCLQPLVCRPSFGVLSSVFIPLLGERVAVELATSEVAIAVERERDPDVSWAASAEEESDCEAWNAALLSAVDAANVVEPSEFDAALWLFRAASTEVADTGVGVTVGSRRGRRRNRPALTTGPLIATAAVASSRYCHGERILPSSSLFCFSGRLQADAQPYRSSPQNQWTGYLKRSIWRLLRRHVNHDTLAMGEERGQRGLKSIPVYEPKPVTQTTKTRYGGDVRQN